MNDEFLDAKQIKSIETVSLGENDVLVIRVDKSVADQDLMNHLRNQAQKIFKHGKVIVCDSNMEFVKITKDEGELIELLKG